MMDPVSQTNPPLSAAIHETALKSSKIFFPRDMLPEAPVTCVCMQTSLGYGILLSRRSLPEEHVLTLCMKIEFTI